jgi:hypothetical protein
MSKRYASEVSLPASFDDYVRHELWRVDPSLAGKGIGLVITQRRNVWRVQRVLKKSPAERAGVEPGRVLHAVNDYEMRKGDVAELQLIVKAGSPDGFRLSVGARAGIVQLVIVPRSLRRIIGTDIALDGGGGGYCNSCRKCYTVINGWVNCGPQGCSESCAVV